MKKSNKLLKIIGALVLVAGIAAATYFIMQKVSPNESNTTSDGTVVTDSEAQKALEEAKKKTAEAAEHEAKGETEAAIEDHKAAMENYQKAGDAGNAEGARMQVEYLQNLPSEPLVETPDPEPMVRGQEHLYD